MKWFTNLFRRPVSVAGAVVFLDTDLLSKDDIERVKQRMTPVFVEFSGRRMVHGQKDVAKAVVQSP